MSAQTVFKRYELKYLLTREQQGRILAAMEGRMTPYEHGKSTVRSIYYDTESYLLIRRSRECSGVYKEKLRLRSYDRAAPTSPVFVELKKKYEHIVYKRRLELPEREAASWLGGGAAPKNTQIAGEISYFLSFYGSLRPAVLLSCEREAFYGKDDPGFRVTFDSRILCRQQELTLDSEVYGEALLPSEYVLMELKCAGGIPFWMARTLSEERIYRTSFSKYGRAYETLIYPRLCAQNLIYGGLNHAG